MQAFGSLFRHQRIINIDKHESVHDTLLTRLSNDDDMARNLSTFASEMASAVMILSL